MICAHLTSSGWNSHVELEGPHQYLEIGKAARDSLKLLHQAGACICLDPVGVLAERKYVALYFFFFFLVKPKGALTSNIPLQNSKLTHFAICCFETAKLSCMQTTPLTRPQRRYKRGKMLKDSNFSAVLPRHHLRTSAPLWLPVTQFSTVASIRSFTDSQVRTFRKRRACSCPQVSLSCRLALSR